MEQREKNKKGSFKKKEPFYADIDKMVLN